MKIVLKDGAHDFATFKQWFFKSDAKAINNLYAKTAHLQEIQGETDLNEQCIKEILNSISGKKVLEVGCGRGYLANLMSKQHDITACDIVVSDSTKKKHPGVKFVQADIEKLPFKDNSFDTVISTHTLEHTKDLQKAVSELRRVAKKELIIVVPRQRPYKYTFSLHTHFFPYDWSIHSMFGYRKESSLKKLGDWFYNESNPHN